MKNILIQYDNVTLFAYALIAIGLFIRYHIGRRRFNRRNLAGMQVFDSYHSAVWVSFAERLIGFIATLFIYGGLIVRTVTAYNLLSIHH